MSSWFIAALSCAVASAAGVCVQAHDVAPEVRACANDDAVACDRLAVALETSFAGANDADRALGHRLAAAAVRVVRSGAAATASKPSGEGVVDVAVHACAAGDVAACGAIATVLVGLVTGADAQLDASPDRLLAHAFAKRMASLAATLAERAGGGYDASSTSPAARARLRSSSLRSW